MASHTLRQYKVLQSSVCFLCLASLGSVDKSQQIRADCTGDYIDVLHNGKTVQVQRAIDLNHVFDNRYIRSTQPCPPSCIGPVDENLGVATTDELGIFDIMERRLVSNSSVLIDTRTAEQHGKGTIPGSLNIPYTNFLLDPTSPQLVESLAMLGVTRCIKNEDGVPVTEGVESTASTSKNDLWDFASAKEVVIWCNGPMDGQANVAIRGLLGLGYPTEQIIYYRGGIRLWKTFGLTTVIPN